MLSQYIRIWIWLTSVLFMTLLLGLSLLKTLKTSLELREVWQPVTKQSQRSSASVVICILFLSLHVYIKSTFNTYYKRTDYTTAKLPCHILIEV